ncbi:DUF1565 domain-containing protein [bacterium]|nr:DUF1565 domain-containing protein [bacterium]
MRPGTQIVAVRVLHAGRNKRESSMDRRVHRWLVLLVLFGMAFPLPVGATDYYVSMSGADSPDRGGVDDPFRTIRYALTIADGDDAVPHIIQVFPGTYDELGGETFPLPLIDQTTVRGSGPAETVVDAEGVGSNAFAALSIESFGVEDLTITGGTFFQGGGLLVAQASDGLIKGVRFEGNRGDSPVFPGTEGYGGALYVHESEDIVVRNCLFIDNSAQTDGGAIGISDADVLLHHLFITGNSCDDNPASHAIWQIQGSLDDPEMRNSIVYGNPSMESASDPTIDETSLGITYSLLENSGGLAWPGTGNLEPRMPLFVDPEEDFHLLTGALCIDAGDPSDSFDREPEPNGGRANIGLYGNTGEAQISGALFTLDEDRWTFLGSPVQVVDGDPGVLFDDDFGGVDPGEETWRFQRWSNEDSLYYRYGEPEAGGNELGEPVDVFPGFGYLVRQRMENEITITLDGHRVIDPVLEVPLESDLSPMLHMVANPYPFPISIGDTRVGYASGPTDFFPGAEQNRHLRWIYTLEGGAEFVPSMGVLQPGEGAVLVTLNHFPNGWQIDNERSDLWSGDPFDGLDWGVSMSASLIDSFGMPYLFIPEHLFGIGETPSYGLDGMDALHIDGPDTTVRFTWVQDTVLPMYHDFRPAEGGSWRVWRAEFLASDILADSVEVYVNGLGPDDPSMEYGFMLWDEDGNELVADLRETPTARVALTPYDSLMRAEVRLVVTHEDWTDAPGRNRHTSPGEFRFVSTYPNPFNSSLRLLVELPNRGDLELRVFDVLGREVARERYDAVQAGRHTLSWHARNLASGPYFVRLSHGHATQVRKVLLMK